MTVPRENFMATETGSGNGSTAFLSFIVGALLVGVGIVGFFMWDAHKSGASAPTPAITVNVKKP
ncbi:MAG: hypothetical protein RL274_738 [Pseudomonadota bacterium]